MNAFSDFGGSPRTCAHATNEVIYLSYQMKYLLILTFFNLILILEHFNHSAHFQLLCRYLA